MNPAGNGVVTVAVPGGSLSVELAASIMTPAAAAASAGLIAAAPS
jgi:hypothetical protein